MSLPGLSLALLDAIEEPALVIEHERVAAANAPAIALLGERVVGRDIRFVLRHPDALEVILAGIGGEREISALGGREQPWTVLVRPLPDGVQLVRLVDRSAAYAAERMRVDFVANASHELRTPLTTMIGYAETLAEDESIDDDLRVRFGATIHGEARRMLRIVEDLMSLSRIEADRFVIPSGRLALDEIARIAAENSALLASKNNCTIALEIAAAGPIAGDFGQLLQLADNLVGNALRYGCGGSASTVTIRTAIEGGRAVLRVIDQGEGIAPDHLTRVTERFYRVDAARSRDSGGTGLGLSIVKHIAERHRSILEIRSIVGQGTHVSVAFPLLPG
ncbi:MAG: ATP-binding protein [Sphingomicrobium sp.]